MHTQWISRFQVLILGKRVKLGVTPLRSASNGAYAQLVHEPNQAECCNHALIPICNTPTTIINFSLVSTESEPPNYLGGLAQASSFSLSVPM